MSVLYVCMCVGLPVCRSVCADHGMAACLSVSEWVGE